MDAARLEDYGWLYQHIQRSCCPDHVQECMYGRAIPRIATDEDRLVTAAKEMKTEMAEATESLTFDDWKNSNVMTVAFGMDGNFPTVFFCKSFVKNFFFLAQVTFHSTVSPTFWLRSSTSK